ncbi:hypothetical protein [Chitinilyticum litopenaei]|uniref:hypothetical protein n=1 Tax=Chitinilyticum litopenaei TaxID=1121276 RepID=UPI00040792C0|nr:hypothetical protein [Chitinilyticum litopenaei]
MLLHVSYLLQYGSNLTALGLSSAAAPYPLAQAQFAANLAAPSNDTVPAGGNDIQVAIAYVNYLHSQASPKTAGGSLVAAAVPCLCPSCDNNAACVAGDACLGVANRGAEPVTA